MTNLETKKQLEALQERVRKWLGGEAA